MTVHYYVLYFGRVQGVGFRYTAQQMARDLDVAGWVKNLPDGSVEMVAEAEEVLVVELLEKIKSFFGGYIQNVQIVKSSASGTDTVFKIVY